MEFIFGSVWGWIGTAGLIVAACAVVFIYIPPLRGYAIALAGVAVSVATIYTKGSRDANAKRDAEAEQLIKNAKDARTSAERTIDANPGGVSNDRFNRDRR